MIRGSAAVRSSVTDLVVQRCPQGHGTAQHALSRARAVQFALAGEFCVVPVGRTLDTFRVGKERPLHCNHGYERAGILASVVEGDVDLASVVHCVGHCAHALPGEDIGVRVHGPHAHYIRPRWIVKGCHGTRIMPEEKELHLWMGPEKLCSPESCGRTKVWEELNVVLKNEQTLSARLQRFLRHPLMRREATALPIRRMRCFHAEVYASF
mmetsp:Transcript_24587/g.72320  ORF Transcript_24587/g.72320 Transcript_24587/m.72320 type:complete len:210 (-) Transcript_24587:97-726(-)